MKCREIEQSLTNWSSLKSQHFIYFHEGPKTKAWSMAWSKFPWSISVQPGFKLLRIFLEWGKNCKKICRAEQGKVKKNRESGRQNPDYWKWTSSQDRDSTGEVLPENIYSTKEAKQGWGRLQLSNTEDVLMLTRSYLSDNFLESKHIFCAVMDLGKHVSIYHSCSFFLNVYCLYYPIITSYF